MSACSLFQFTPLREGRPASRRESRRHHYFNSRPCVRGDEEVDVNLCVKYLFQFTPLREGRRTANVDFASSGLDFNSRPCVRGDASVHRIHLSQ